MCICIIVSFAFHCFTSVGFKTSRTMSYSEGGTVCSLDVLDENKVRISSAIVKYRDFAGSLIKAKIMGTFKSWQSN